MTSCKNKLALLVHASIILAVFAHHQDFFDRLFIELSQPERV